MASNNTLTLPPPHWVDLRLPNNKLAARYDPLRGVLELRINGQKCWFDFLFTPGGTYA